MVDPLAVAGDPFFEVSFLLGVGVAKSAWYGGEPGEFWIIVFADDGEVVGYVDFIF